MRRMRVSSLTLPLASGKFRSSRTRQILPAVSTSSTKRKGASIGVPPGNTDSRLNVPEHALTDPAITDKTGTSKEVLRQTHST
jgi:hypothetical protein